MYGAAVRRGIVSGKIGTNNNTTLDTTQLTFVIDAGDCVTLMSFLRNMLVFDTKSLVFLTCQVENANQPSGSF